MTEGLTVNVHNQKLKCSYKGQIVEFKVTDTKKSLAVYFGNIICPSCEEICGAEFQCPAEVHTNKSLGNQDAAYLPSASSNMRNNKKQYYSTYLNNQHGYCLKQMALISDAKRITNSTCLLVYYFSSFLLIIIFS